MPKQSPWQAVDEFIRTIRKRPDRPTTCSFCTLRNAADVNRAIVRFEFARASGETTQTWDAFLRLVLIKKFKIPQIEESSLRRHKRNCIGLS